MRDSVIKSVTQIALIVFSVVLGLFLSERIEDRKERGQAEKLLSKIKMEVRENKALMESWVPYHEKIMADWDSLYQDEEFIRAFIQDKTTLYDKVFSRGSIIGRSPVQDAWEIAKSHPLIVNIDYDQLLILSKIYNQQKVTLETFEKIPEIFRSPDFNSKENVILNLERLEALMEEFLALELQLMKYYHQADSLLDL